MLVELLFVTTVSVVPFAVTTIVTVSELTAFVTVKVVCSPAVIVDAKVIFAGILIFVIGN